MSIDLFNRSVTLLAFAALVGAVAILAIPAVRRFVRPWGLHLGALVALVSTAGSLTYSEYFGYEPCRLCWFQRTAMYPLVIVLGVAVWRRHREARWYAIPLATIGLAISVYHYLLQTFPSLEGSGSCALGASCAAKFVNEFGFVSIPLMAGCGFLAIIASTSIARPKDES